MTVFIDMRTFNFRHFDDNGKLIPEKAGRCYHIWWNTWFRRYGRKGEYD